MSGARAYKVREEVELSRLLRRALASALAAAFVVASAAPCLADETATRRNTSLTKLSAASLHLLKAPAASARATQEPSTPSSPGSFFRSRKGVVALALVAGAVGFTIWSGNDSRKDVKSPVR